MLLSHVVDIFPFLVVSPTIGDTVDVHRCRRILLSSWILLGLGGMRYNLRLEVRVDVDDLVQSHQHLFFHVPGTCFRLRRHSPQIWNLHTYVKFSQCGFFTSPPSI